MAGIQGGKEPTGETRTKGVKRRECFRGEQSLVSMLLKDLDKNRKWTSSDFKKCQLEIGKKEFLVHVFKSSVSVTVKVGGR